MKNVPWILLALALAAIIWLLVLKNQSDKRASKAQITVKTETMEVDRSEYKYRPVITSLQRELDLKKDTLQQAGKKMASLRDYALAKEAESIRLINQYRAPVTDRASLPCDSIASDLENWMLLFFLQQRMCDTVITIQRNMIADKDSIIATQQELYGALRISFDKIAGTPVPLPTAPKKPTKWSVGPVVGYGLTNNKPSPFAGIGITYRLINF